MIVLWRVSNHCNLACPFCAYDKRLAIPREQADPAQVARMIDLLGAWRRERGRPVLLSWLGGEPLLWAPREALDARAVENGIGLSLTTNGTRLGAARVRDELVRRYREVTISIDGPAAFHDAMRGWRGANDKLAVSVPALVAARDAAGSALKVRANVVLMRDNIGAFAALCRALAGWGIDEISFNQLGGRDRPEFYPAHRLRAEDVALLAGLVPRLRAELATSGTALVGGPAYLDRIADTVAGRPLPIADCRVAESFLFIDEAGRIAPCSFAPEHFDLSVDALRTPADLDALPQRLQAHQRARPARDCADCPSTQQFAKFASLAA
ncbi:MoaA/NifB/PqqE/SkfB family radical SAM enzyme [Sphingomonas naasensis]|uniref:Radical SAM protein n=1 Tax=Sphingomonas naasensis TaxID=1344951 RepID=A0A4S1WQR5_9SPHN|nr:radical SAM protein [Sphingomonas naasensis]NIJ18424.1 MoaA/NifB/PqqE/SkfB family radical SAM enzyme [Sphingomonas naasensis]TGX45689.1 radical SAM protein [Sphingomonas naasensis]